VAPAGHPEAGSHLRLPDRQRTGGAQSVGELPSVCTRLGERTVDGGQFTDVTIQGLGDEAWRIQEDFPGGQEVTYGWRRRTLLLQVHIQCIFQTCPSDIGRAGRAWADAIDKEACTSG
jgi:hypothetical protein